MSMSRLQRKWTARGGEDISLSFVFISASSISLLLFSGSQSVGNFDPLVRLALLPEYVVVAAMTGMGFWLLRSKGKKAEAHCLQDQSAQSC